MLMYADNEKDPRGPHSALGSAGGNVSSRATKGRESKEKPMLVRYSEWLEQPVHSSTIAIFRMLYALCVLAQLSKWSDMFEKFNKSYAVFPYPMMSWVQPLSPGYGHMLMDACRFFSVLQLIGLFTPVSTFGVFFTFSWLFFTCESNHNNHYLLMCHLTFCGAFLGWGKWMSVDQLIRAKMGRIPDPRVPRWSLLVVRLIFCVPYLYGAFAKMNYDWLFRAQPIKMWFEGQGGIFDVSAFHWFICYSGCAFDLVISFLLWYRPTRYIIGFPGALAFNISNKIMLNIGIFPMMMIASLILFLEPYHPAQLIAFILRRKVHGLPSDITEAEAEAKRDDDSHKDQHLQIPLLSGNVQGSRRAANILDKKCGLLTLRQWWGVIFFTSFCIFHALNPLREKVLYPDNPSWTEEGHFGAWHMKLRSKDGVTLLHLLEKDGTRHMLDPMNDDFVHFHQMYKVPSKPHMLMLYINRLKMLFEAAGRPLEAVHADSCHALNDRKYYNLYIPQANLLNFCGRYEWLGVTGVGKFLYGDEKGPRCNPGEVIKNYSPKEAKRMLAEVRDQAGIFMQRDGHGKKRIMRRVEGGVEDAYTWPMLE